MSDLEALRADVVAWLRRRWDPDMTMREWWGLLARSGYAVPDWPTHGMGLGLTAREAVVVRKAIATEQLPGPPAGIGMMMAGPTIIAHGTPEQQARYLPGIVTGESNWCQLFSEPEAGSDLAGLRTTARRSDGGWVVNGQKVWSSNAHLADMAMLLARTDPAAPKHSGITWFAFDMTQPGIEVRPLREMTGRSLFNEVFISEANVRDDAVVGRLHDGWSVARTTLAAERAALGSGVGAVGGIPGRTAGVLDTRAGDVAARLQRPRRTSGTSIAMRGRTFDRLRELATERGRLDDPAVRAGLVELFCLETVTEQLGTRARAARKQGGRSGPEGPIQKLLMSDAVRTARDLALQILGAAGLLDGNDAPHDGIWQEMALFSCAVSIYGGTDEIQRNVLAERVLGLPREP
jgi:alkylation response protein AidB-like acyl-CoA dehydrogenase